MLWSMKQIGDWETNVKNAKPYKYDHILCINECVRRPTPVLDSNMLTNSFILGRTRLASRT